MIILCTGGLGGRIGKKKMGRSQGGRVSNGPGNQERIDSNHPQMDELSSKSQMAG